MKLQVEFFYYISNDLYHMKMAWFSGMQVRDVLQLANYQLGMEESVGIFGKITAIDSQVMPGDRIEIYKSLLIDPKEARRLRAAKKGKKG